MCRGLYRGYIGAIEGLYTWRSMAWAISISVQPPPQMTRVSLTVSVSTHSAS